MKRLVIIDNGHGADTPGKCSPDGRHREFRWCRDAAQRLAESLRSIDLDSKLLVPEENDIPLRERCRRAAALSSGRDAILISIHNNASGRDGAWHTASGWSVFVSPNASAASRRLASVLHRHAAAAGLSGNRRTPICGYWTANLALCRDTPCPAVLTENMFQDNAADLAFLTSEHGTATLVGVHFTAIKEYFGL